MNRYELHQAIEEARKEGYDRAVAALTSQGTSVKPRLVAHFVRSPMVDGYSFQLVLYVGSKYYTAQQTFVREELTRYARAGDERAFKKQIGHWLESAKQALYKEFDKDVEVFAPDFPNGI